MQIEPPADAFAARYERGEAQVVWTTLVADLETPVSAFLKIAGARPMSFLFESVEGGAVRGRYSVIGLDPDLIWRTQRRAAPRSTAPRAAKPDGFAPCPQPPLEALRALIAESRIALPDGLPPMAAGVFGYLGYDMVRLMEELPAAQSRSDRHSRRGADPPDARRGVRCGEGLHHRRHAGAARAGRHGRRPRSRAREERLSGVVDALDRPLDKAAAGDRDRAARRPGEIQHHAGRIPGDGAEGQGLHPGRRHLPGGAVAALRGAVHAAAVRALPRAAPRQSGAVPLFPRLRRLRGRGIEPGDPGAAARRHGDDPPARRHPAARRDAARGQGAGGANCSPIRRSAPSI